MVVREGGSLEEVVAVEGGRKTVRRSPVLGKGEEEQTAERQPAFQELRHRLVGRAGPHRARPTNCNLTQSPLVLLHVPRNSHTQIPGTV